MTRIGLRRLAALGACTFGAVGAVGAQAHGDPHPVINGPEKQGTVVPTVTEEGKKFALPRVTLDCPPPEAGDPCAVTVTVKTKKSYRLKAGKSKKIRTLGRIHYEIASNREQAPIELIPLRKKGRRLLRDYGSIKARAKVKIEHHEAIIRTFRLTLNP